MKFLNEQKKLYPNLSDTIDDVNRLINSLKSRKVNIIDPGGRPITPKAVWNLQSYVQVTLHRAVDLSSEVCNSWNKGQVAVSFLLVRALFENATFMYDLSILLTRYIKEDKFQEVYDLIVNRMFGSRTFTALPKSINVMTVIEKLDKKFEGLKDSYERLSEFCHPNYSAMYGLYAKLNKKEIYYEIDQNYGISEMTFNLIITALCPALLLIEEGMNNIESLYPDLTKLSNKDLEKTRKKE